MKKVKWFAGKHLGLCQAVSSGMEFAFLSPDDEQITQFYFCKDYIHEMMRGHLYQRMESIYGFRYDAKENPPVDMTKTKILVNNRSDKEFEQKIPAALEFIHQIEDKLGIENKTTFEKCLEPPMIYEACGVWYIEADKRWQVAPPMISMFTLLLRASFSHKIGNNFRVTLDEVCASSHADKHKLTSARSGIDRILQEGDVKIFGTDPALNYWKDLTVSDLHNNTGIVAFSQGRTKGLVPRWHE